jgi:hypothetical protein
MCSHIHLVWGYCLVLSGVWTIVETSVFWSAQLELNGPTSQRGHIQGCTWRCTVVFVRDLLLLYVRSRRGLVMARLVAADVGQQRRPGFLPCGFTWRELGHLPCLMYLLDRNSVVLLASQTCSTETWSLAPLRGLARQGLGCSPRLAY